MGRLLPAIAFFLVALPVSLAAVSPQVYWNNVLPDTPMPSAIKDLLYPDALEDSKGTSVTVGKPGSSGHTTVGVGHGGVRVVTGKGKPGGRGGTAVAVGHGGVTVHTNPKGKPVHVYVKPFNSPFGYDYKATDDQLRADPNAALFFLEKDLRPGAKMSVHFTTSDADGATLLSRRTADSIPFTSSKLQKVLARYSVQPNSLSAKTMARTLRDCESPATEGETKRCVTSLESMIDFATSTLGTTDVLAVSTEVDKSGATVKQEYTVSSEVHKVGGGKGKAVACHKQPYVYAVFLCHGMSSTEVYAVPMAGKDGARVEAVAVCHRDTSRWNPKHLAFRVLKVKPGAVPVCHFLPRDHVVWNPRK